MLVVSHWAAIQAGGSVGPPDGPGNRGREFALPKRLGQAWPILGLLLFAHVRVTARQDHRQ